MRGVNFQTTWCNNFLQNHANWHWVQLDADHCRFKVSWKFAAHSRFDSSQKPAVKAGWPPTSEFGRCYMARRHNRLFQHLDHIKSRVWMRLWSTKQGIKSWTFMRVLLYCYRLFLNDCLQANHFQGGNGGFLAFMPVLSHQSLSLATALFVINRQYPKNPAGTELGVMFDCTRTISSGFCATHNQRLRVCHPGWRSLVRNKRPGSSLHSCIFPKNF